jgi:hypothetical protein
VGTRFVQSAPASSKGTDGNTQGSVAFDDSYIYYCTADYVPNTFSTTIAEPGLSFQTFPVVKGDYGTPTTAWTVIWDNVEFAITNVADGGDSWILTTPTQENATGGEGIGVTLYNGVTLEDIWRRVAWSNDTWGG